MKKALRIFAIILTLMLVSGVACAEGINLDQYTYEQLVQLRQQVIQGLAPALMIG